MQKMSVFTLLVLFAVLLIQDVSSNRSECRDAVVPPTKPRGVNQVDRSSNTPLFSLQLKQLEQHNRKNKRSSAYKVSVSIPDGVPQHFSEATLSVTVNGSCGLGEFDFLPGDYDDILQDDDDQCPRLLHTRQKLSMTNLPPLVWIPPSCGCFQIRILLVDSGKVYYAENEDVTNGHLVQTICFDHQRIKKVSRKQRLSSLCHVIDKHSSSEIISRGQFLGHRNLDHRYMDYLGLEMAMELRRSDAMSCCSMILDADKMKCFEDARRRRIDGFCEDGVPDIPFRNFRQRHMMQLEKKCCFILGEERYDCFAKNSAIGDDIHASSSFDFSMDATDVANDLADFGSQEHLDEYLRPIGLEDDNDDDEDEDNDGFDDFDEENSYVDVDEESKELDLEKEEDSEDEEQLYPSKISESKYKISQLPRKAMWKTPIPVSPTPYYLTSKTLPRKSSLEREIMKQEIKRKRKNKHRSSKELKRMSSAERRSAERRMRVLKRKGERGGNSKRRDMLRNEKSIERKEMRRASSAERKRRKDRRGRHPMKAEDVMNPGQLGFDDQGGSSTDMTLKKLRRKMKRLKLQRMCCEAGGNIGTRVYGGLNQVTEECSHSSQKFIRNLDLGSKSRKCVDHFVHCCLEKSKKGLTMTSQEFIETSMLTSWDNNKEYDPQLFDRVLSQRGRNQKQQKKNSRIANVKVNFGNMDQNAVLTSERVFPKEEAGFSVSKSNVEPKSKTVVSKQDETKQIELKRTGSVKPKSPVLKKIVFVQIDTPQTETKTEAKSIVTKPVVIEQPKQETEPKRKLVRNHQSKLYQSMLPSTSKKLGSQPIGALDSREMAERNAKKFRDALDSREMADQYVRNNNKRKSSWYRAQRNYRNKLLTNRWRSMLG